MAGDARVGARGRGRKTNKETKTKAKKKKKVEDTRGGGQGIGRRDRRVSLVGFALRNRGFTKATEIGDKRDNS